MANDLNHIIHLANGQLSPNSTTSREDVARIMQRATEGHSAAGLVIHFHGGLVSEKSARQIAQRLIPIYSEAGAYPLFLVWEAGLFEAIFNNLHDISQEKIFQEFVKKVAEWVIKKLPSNLGLKGSSGGMVNEIELRQQFDEWFSGKRPAPPDALGLQPGASQATMQTTLKGTVLDQPSLEAEIQLSIEGDFAFQDAVQEVFNGLGAVGMPQPTTKGAIGTTSSSTSLISPEAADQLFDRSPATTKGFSLFGWIKAAKMVAAIVVAVVKRYSQGRAHGLYVTVVEEVLRSLYLDKVGKVVWDQMKKDTADSFLPGENHGGTALLAELKKFQQAGITLPRITLIGHSTGAVYICCLLEAAAEISLEVKFDVVFLAPAVTYEQFAKTVGVHGNLVGHFRSFAMTDDWEGDDSLVPIIYPHSLLYFISGLLEKNVDEPLVGMERYLREKEIFTDTDFPYIAGGRIFYDKFENCLVWAPSTVKEGCKTSSTKHGDFDNDPATLDSLQWLLKEGF